MADKIEQIIKQADALMKQERYAEAWKLLLPHKEDENALKRLKWLKAKRDQLKLETEIAAAPVAVKQSGGWFSRLGWRMKLGLGLFILCSGCTAFAMFGQWVGFIPDATEMTETKVAEISATDAILTRDAPTATNTPSETPTATASMTETDSPTATASPSETITTSPTTTLTATASPTQNLNELRLENEQLSFTIQSFVFLRTIQGYDFVSGAGIVVLGTIENNGTQFGCLYGNEMHLILDNRMYPADDIVMSLFQVGLSPYRDYLGNFGGQCLSAGESAQSFIAFDVPLSVGVVEFQYLGDQKPLSINWDSLVFANEELSLAELYAASTNQPTAAAIRATESLLASQTASQWTSTPTFTPAPPTATSDTSQEDERDIINMIRGATDLDVESVEIADGRANGGERVAIITYRSSAVTDGDLGGEWGSIFGAVYNAIQLNSIDIDSVSVIIGNRNGTAIGIVGVSVEDINAFMDGQITGEEFYRRLSITDL